MGKNPLTPEPPVRAEPVEPEIVTAPVTAWAAVGLTEEEWNALEIPPFLRRTATTTTPPRPAATPVARTTSADATAGPASGATGSSTAMTAGVTGGMFDQFRVDPDEIERKIKAEAERLWYTWEGPHRPRKSTLIKRVRKDYYK